MTGTPNRLERALEVVLGAGVVLCGALLGAGLLWGHSDVLRAGILLLLFTPVARVVVVVVGLAFERDWVFALIALWILLVLLSSLRVARLW